MAVHVITQMDSARNPEDDIVNRQRREHAARQDPKEEFKTETVMVEYGPKKAGGRDKSAVVLRYAWDSCYIFAVYADNPAWADRDRDEWEGSAKNAIEKFLAMRNLRIKMTPKPEDTNRYNVMCETATPIEVSEATKQRYAEEMARRAAMAQQMQREFGR